MSKVIKNSVKSGDIVTIDASGSEFAPVPRSPKTPEEIRSALNFQGTINSLLGDWQKKMSAHSKNLEQSVKGRIEDADRQGYERGFAEGAKQERTDRDTYVDEMFGDRIKVIETLLGEAKRVQSHAFHGLEVKLVTLAISIAEKIIQKSIETDPKIVETIVTDAMSQIISGEKLILKVSAEDFKVINANYDKWFSMAGNVKEFKIEIDKRLTSGDCLIETEGGDIDASVSSRLDILTEELLKVSR